MMRFNIGNILKYGLSAAAILITVEKLYLYYYFKRKNHIAQRPIINDILFVMSDGLPCCRHSENERTVQNCRNPHCKAKLSHRIIKEIESAKHLVCIAMYMLTNRRIGRTILSAVQRGVNVRMITDYSMLATSGSQIDDLRLGGVEIRIAGAAGNGDKYMHNKFCLIDVLNNESGADQNKNPVNGILINGSMNWTSNAFDRNWENVLFTSDERMKSEYKKAFDYMWSRLDSPNVPGTSGI